MSNSELLAQLRQLSRDDKIEMMQFLTAELAKEEGLKSLGNGVVYRLWSPYDYGDAAQKLISLLEQEEAKILSSVRVRGVPSVDLGRGLVVFFDEWC